MKKSTLATVLIALQLTLLGLTGCGGGGLPPTPRATSATTATTEQAASQATMPGGLGAGAPTAQTAQTTKWKASVDDNGVAHLQVSKDEGTTYEEFVVKGVDYSPAPIGYNVRQSLDLGDLFWESPKPEWFTDWSKVWKRDLENMRNLGINCIRVYNMTDYHFAQDTGGNTYIPDPAKIPDNDHGLFVFTHQKFLDACWNGGDRPIYVIVGLGTHEVEWHKTTRDAADNDPPLMANLKFWDANIDATSKEVGNHPAVLGYTMFNELMDRSCYDGDTPATTYFWSQVQKDAATLHQNSPGKLVGWANQDAPEIPNLAKANLEKYGNGVDFFGINSYQIADCKYSFDTYRKENLGALARPVITTEYGYPCTGHSVTTTYKPYENEPAAPRKIPGGTDRNLVFVTLENVVSMFEDDTTRAKTAEMVKNVMPTYFKHPICVGVTYFEWSDEWWKENPKVPFEVPNPRGGTMFEYDIPTNPQKHEGGVVNGGFPNGYADEESFGLYSISLNGRDADKVFTADANGVAGNTKPDALTARQGLLDTVTGIYKTADSMRPTK